MAENGGGVQGQTRIVAPHEAGLQEELLLTGQRSICCPGNGEPEAIGFDAEIRLQGEDHWVGEHPEGSWTAG